MEQMNSSKFQKGPNFTNQTEYPKFMFDFYDQGFRNYHYCSRLVEGSKNGKREMKLIV